MKIVLFILNKIWEEWMGEGVHLGRGNFSEFGWANVANIPIGILIASTASQNIESHILVLILEHFPRDYVITVFILSGVFTDLGTILFFIRGRCVASRICRLLGAWSGLTIWAALFLSILKIYGMEFVMLPMFTWATLSYARGVCLAWRRF